MKKILVLTSLFLIMFSVSNAEEFHVVTAEEVMNLDSVGNDYVVSPKNTAKAQHTMNQVLQNMYDTYSLPELAHYALRLNEAQIREALRNGQTPPKTLTREILTDRDKIIEYLKSEYKVEY